MIRESDLCSLGFGIEHLDSMPQNALWLCIDWSNDEETRVKFGDSEYIVYNMVHMLGALRDRLSGVQCLLEEMRPLIRCRGWNVVKCTRREDAICALQNSR